MPLYKQRSRAGEHEASEPLTFLAELRAFADDTPVADVIEQWVAEGVTNVRLLFLSPLQQSSNLKMREKVCNR